MKARIWGMAAVLALGCAAPATAAPLNEEHVPADATWLAHADVDAMRSSEVVVTFYEECIAGRKPDEMFDKVAEHCGMDPRKDLHSVTLCATCFSNQVVTRPCNSTVPPDADTSTWPDEKRPVAVRARCTWLATWRSSAAEG